MGCAGAGHEAPGGGWGLRFGDNFLPVAMAGLRVNELSEGYEIKATCRQCWNTKQLSHKLLLHNQRREMLVYQMERRLKCPACNTRGLTILTVRVASRN